MKSIIRSTVLLFSLILISNCSNFTPPVTIQNPVCEYLTNPTGIDTPAPRFSWQLTSNQRGQTQTAYRILVASRPNNLEQELGDLWDSGRIESDQNLHIQYQGEALKSNQTCYWQVKVWDKAGNASKWSEQSYFTTGMFDKWQAEWIGKDPDFLPVIDAKYYDSPAAKPNDTVNVNERSTLLRKEFNTSGAIKRAVVNVTGLGFYELYLNGSKVGDKILNPVKTNYRNKVYYDVYDVTNMLQSGQNAVGIELGNGWFNPLKKWWSWRMQWFGPKRAILQMLIEYKDGSTEQVITDESWKAADGAILSSCVYDGEYYDARIEKQGWNAKEYNDSQWEPVKTMTAPGGKLVAQTMEPIKITQTIEPVSATEPQKGVYVYDMGQNFAGWAKIKLNGTANTIMTVQYAENLLQNGLVDKNTNNLVAAKDTYILNGNESETYEPHFTYHGFRYVQITAEPALPEIESVTGCVVHSSCDITGSFETGNILLNKVQQATLWSQRSNMVGYPMDCPQRDERLGWLGDAHITAEEAMYNFHTPLFYKYWLNSIQLGQDKQSGDIPYIIPRPSTEGGTPAWSSAYILILWYHYQFYGDKQILADHYENLKAYLDHLSSTAEGYILPHDKYGDWYSIEPDWSRGKPESVGTFYYYYNSILLSKIAGILNLRDDQQKYNELSNKIQDAYNKKYFDAKQNIYENGGQYSNSAPLFLGITPDASRQDVLQSLFQDIIKRDKGHILTGILGTKYMMETLSYAGANEIAYLLATQPDYPGWYDLVKTRTTLSEHWDQSGSNNHVMFGSISSWYYKFLAGIQTDETQPGFKHIIIKPYIQAETGYVDATVNTLYGIVKSNWTCTETDYQLNITIPVNTTATVYLPAKDKESVKESKKPVSDAEGVQFVKMDGNLAVFEVGSGNYSFSVGDIKTVIDKPAVTSPEITPNLQYFFKPDNLAIELKCGSQDAKIYYTLDGSEPTQESTLYKKPFSIDSSTQVRARSFKAGCKPSQIAFKLYTCIDPEKNGVQYQIYNGDFQDMPNFNKLQPDVQGYVYNIDLKDLPLTTNMFAVQYNGFIDIEKTGDYTFYSGSNDGSIVYIDEKMVVDNGTGHIYIEKSGNVHLEAGRHKIRTTYFQKGGAKALDVSYEGPGIEKQIVPALILFRE